MTPRPISGLQRVRWVASEPVRRVIVVVWVAGFLVGTATHVVDLIAGGTGAYGGHSTPVRLYWVSLTVLDPLAAVLVMLGRRSGIVLGVTVMVSDVAVNWGVLASVGGLSMSGLALQTTFCLVVVVTAPVLWRRFAHGRSEVAGPRV